MGIVNGISIVNNLLAGSLSGAQLQSYLSTGLNRASFAQVIHVRRQIRLLAESPSAMAAVAASSTAMTAVAASSTAMEAVIASSAAWAAVMASSTAMAAVAASSTAMTAVAASYMAMTAVIANSTAWATVVASSTAMTAVAASPTAMTAVTANSTAVGAICASVAAKMAVFSSDAALAALASSSVALTTMRAAAGYTVYNKSASSTLTQAITGPNAAGSYILVGLSKNTANVVTITAIKTRRSESGRPVTANVGATSSDDASTVPMCTPLTSPFTFTQSDTPTSHWYFGMLRCDV